MHNGRLPTALRAPLSDDQRQQLVTIITTEHFTLQTARGATISDTNGRASLFMSTVSSGLVALAFIAQIAGPDADVFRTFMLVLLPTLWFLGMVTFARVLESAIEDMLYARGINRLRHLYLELSPEAEDYFILKGYDDGAGTSHNMGMSLGRWQYLLTTAGMIGVITSVLLGVGVGFVLQQLGAVSLAVSAGVGIGVFVLSALLLSRYQQARWKQLGEQMTVLFPSPPTQERQTSGTVPSTR